MTRILKFFVLPIAVCACLAVAVGSASAGKLSVLFLPNGHMIQVKDMSSEQRAALRQQCLTEREKWNHVVCQLDEDDAVQPIAPAVPKDPAPSPVNSSSPAPSPAAKPAAPKAPMPSVVNASSPAPLPPSQPAAVFAKPAAVKPAAAQVGQLSPAALEQQAREAERLRAMNTNEFARLNISQKAICLDALTNPDAQGENSVAAHFSALAPIMVECDRRNKQGDVYSRDIYLGFATEDLRSALLMSLAQSCRWPALLHELHHRGAMTEPFKALFATFANKSSPAANSDSQGFTMYLSQLPLVYPYKGSRTVNLRTMSTAELGEFTLWMTEIEARIGLSAITNYKTPELGTLGTITTASVRLVYAHGQGFKALNAERRRRNVTVFQFSQSATTDRLKSVLALVERYITKMSKPSDISPVYREIAAELRRRGELAPVNQTAAPSVGLLSPASAPAGNQGVGVGQQTPAANPNPAGGLQAPAANPTAAALSQQAAPANANALGAAQQVATTNANPANQPVNANRNKRPADPSAESQTTSKAVALDVTAARGNLTRSDESTDEYGGTTMEVDDDTKEQ